jgi:hypothetical protein
MSTDTKSTLEGGEVKDLGQVHSDEMFMSSSLTSKDL